MADIIIIYLLTDCCIADFNVLQSLMRSNPKVGSRQKNVQDMLLQWYKRCSKRHDKVCLITSDVEASQFLSQMVQS